MAIPMRPCGVRGVLWYRYIWGKPYQLRKGPKGMAIPNRGKPMAKQNIQTRVDLYKGMS
jgi:hypothetical protein